MGNQNCAGFPNPISEPTSAGKAAKPSYILRRAKSLNTTGGVHSSREGSCSQNAQSSAPRELLFNSFPSSQEGWSDETGNQSQEIERMGGAPALQNGGLGDPPGASEGERLDGEGGPQGCLLHSTNSYSSPTHAEISGGVRTLSIRMPAFPPVMCTLGIHQGDETSSHLPLEYGSENDHLHRRHSVDGRICRAGDTPPGSSTVPVDRFGVHCQCPQVSNFPNSADTVPGSPGTLNNTTPEFASGKSFTISGWK